jgi:hypothetical protein
MIVGDYYFSLQVDLDLGIIANKAGKTDFCVVVQCGC